MLKKLLALTMALTACMFAACGTEPAENVNTVDFETVKTAVTESIDFQGEMVTPEGDALLNFYNFPEGSVKNSLVLISSAFIGEELTIVETTDAGRNADVEAVMNSRIETLKEAFDGYLPEEFAAVNDTATVAVNGNYVMFICGEKATVDTAVSTFNGLFK